MYVCMCVCVYVHDGRKEASLVWELLLWEMELVTSLNAERGYSPFTSP